MQHSNIYKLCEQELEQSQKQNKNNGLIFNCPFCGSGNHKNKSTAFIIDPQTNKFNCFACGENGDVFDLVGKLYNISNFYRQKEKLSTLLNLESRYLADIVKKHPKPTPTPTNTPKSSYKPNYAVWKQNNNKVKGKYLLKRGISLNTQKKADIGYCKNWTHPKAKKNYPTERIIIPNGDYNYLSRYVGKGKIQAQYQKMKVGNNAPIYRWEQAKKHHFIVVCEGELDCLSVIEESCLCGVCALGGVSQKDKFLKAVKAEYEKGIKHNYFICLDNDKAGIETQNYISEKLWNLNILNLSMKHKDYPPNTNDINDWLVEQKTKNNVMWLGAYIDYIKDNFYNFIEEKAHKKGLKKSQIYSMMDFDINQYPETLIMNCDREYENAHTKEYVKFARNEILFIIGYWNNDTTTKKDVLPLSLAINEYSEKCRYLMLVSADNVNNKPNNASTFDYLKKRADKREYKHLFILIDNERECNYFAKLPNSTPIKIDFKNLSFDYLQKVVKVLVKSANDGVSKQQIESFIQTRLKDVKNYD